MSTSNKSKAITQSLSLFETMLTDVETGIQAAVENGKSVSGTHLAKEMAPKFDMSWQHAYGVVKVYLSTRPDLGVKNGPNGGIHLTSQS